jgi:16S rRNA (adenine1518-N6/adenine1519-N6)-dimethyltransferase
MTPKARKQFAQHWLRSEEALNQIVAAAQLQKSDGPNRSFSEDSAKDNRILEIGPGTGILTRRLLPEAQSVVAVEMTRDLCKLLSKTSRGSSPRRPQIELPAISDG